MWIRDRVKVETIVFFFQAEDGIRDLVRSRGLGDVYKRQDLHSVMQEKLTIAGRKLTIAKKFPVQRRFARCHVCLLYTSDAADDLLCVDIGGRRIIKKKINKN